MGGAVIDLHTHTTASDGTDTPAGLVERAARLGLEALAITDHDTLSGSDEAVTLAGSRGLQLVRGLELSTRRTDEADPASRSVHILGYFFGEPAAEFRTWLESLRAKRRARNEAMAAKLRSMGMDVTVDEAEAVGRNITGRPHFARVLRDKGYVKSYEQAFKELLGERCPAYVEREDPTPAEGIRRIREAGGIASLAHARRMNAGDGEDAAIRKMVDAGLGAIEVWHPDHDGRRRDRYRRVAEKHGLAITGGSDFHGEMKPDILLGRGIEPGHRVPLGVLDDLRRRAERG